MNRPHQIGSDLPSQPLEPLRPEVRFLVLPLLTALGLHVSPLATVPTLASKVRVICLGTSCRFTIVFLVLVFPFVFAFLAFAFLPLDAFHLPDVHRS